MGIEQHPNIVNLNTLFDSIKETITNSQASYGVLHGGELFQGIQLMDIEAMIAAEQPLPNGITPLDCDTNVKPHDQGETWQQFNNIAFTSNLKLPVNVRISKIEIPIVGWAWAMTMEFWYDGIGPDYKGTIGSHWVKRCWGGAANPGGVWDIWFIMDDSSPT